MENWQSTASLSTLKKRAAVINKIRDFFNARGLLEVETPLLSHAGVTDLHIESIKTTTGHYLQTSPEFAMKRLLAQNSGPIFQISKAFRQGEHSNKHNPEFTLLEWYRPGFNHHQLMDEVDELLQILFTTEPATRLSYQAAFTRYLNINPHQCTIDELKALSKQQHIVAPTLREKDDWLHLLFSHCIESRLPAVCFIYDYPKTQAALAKINGDIAERFEVYIGGIELANGFHELCDVAEQEQRFEADLHKRHARHLPPVIMDRRLLAALRHGLPDCAGIALGIDRLMMAQLNAKTIDEVISFPFERA